MAWEQRGNQTYYYTKTRVGDKVISTYVGSGVVADLASQLDYFTAQDRQQEQERWQQEREEEAAIDAAIRDYADQVRIVTKAALLASGCHQHKRQWRVRRDTDI